MSSIRTESWKEKQAWARLVGERTIAGLARRNVTAEYVATSAEAVATVKGRLTDGCKVAYGDSASLYESGILALIKSGAYQVAEWDKPGLSGEETHRLWVDGFSADVFFSGVNALTDDGVIVNLDSTGNRIAPIFFGPKKVVLLAGINKLVHTRDEAFARAHQASVINNIRWQMKSPCVQTGRCVDCQGSGRICAYTQVIENNVVPGRIHVIIVGESLGY